MAEESGAPSSTRRSSRNGALDGLRLLAALSVVGFHYVAFVHSDWTFTLRDSAPNLFRITKFGYFGVDLFFVISGYVILMSAWGKSIGNFIGSRISRLFPAYWVAVLFSTLLILTFASGHPSLAQIGANLTMAQSAFGIAHIDGVYWTLWVEAHFYLIIGVFLVVGITKRRVLVLCGTWPIIGMIAQASDAHLLASLLQPTYAPLFAGGMLLYILKDDPRSVAAWLLLGSNVAWALSTAGPDAASSIRRLTGSGISDASTAIVTIGCFALVGLTTLTGLRRLRWRWLTTAGLLTYPLYLVHESLGWTIIEHSHGFIPWQASVVVAVLASVLLAFAINRFVERPSARPLRKSIESSLDERTPASLRRGGLQEEAPPQTVN